MPARFEAGIDFLSGCSRKQAVAAAVAWCNQIGPTVIPGPNTKAGMTILLGLGFLLRRLCLRANFASLTCTQPLVNAEMARAEFSCVRGRHGFDGFG